jgi:hypothetical protein
MNQFKREDLRGISMPRYFTTYWKNEQWERQRQRAAGEPQGHISANNLRKKGIRPGDCLYVVTLIEGRLFLAGRIEVGEMLTQSQAESLFEQSLYSADDHILAREGSEMAFDLDRVVPRNITTQLRFVKKREQPVPLVFKGKGLLDQQTLRSIRELTYESARLLDALLDSTAGTER